MPNNITQIPALRVPIIDEKTGLMSREWYRFFINIFTLTGDGSNTFSLSDLQVGPPPVDTSAVNTVFTASTAGLAPASGGGTANFLRADGTFALPPVTAPAGSTTEIQFNNAGAFGASSNFTYTSGTNTVSFGNITGSALGMTIQPLAPTSVQDAGILAITTQNAVKANSTGGRLTVNTGAGTGTAAGGHLWARTGASGTGFSGDVFVSTYNATTPSKSGSIVFDTTSAPFAYSDGRIQFNNLYGSLALASFGIECFLLSDPVNGNGLPILFTAGNNSVAGQPGGRVSFEAGNDVIGGNPGGDITFRAGTGTPPGAVRIASYSNAGSNVENIVVYDDVVSNSITRIYGGVNTSGNPVIEVFGDASLGVDKLGFFNATPVAQAAAYTKTYSTASRTIPNATFTNLVTTAATNVAPYGFATQAQADAIATKVNALAADVLILKQLIVSLVNDSSTTLGVGLNAT